MAGMPRVNEPGEHAPIDQRGLRLVVRDEHGTFCQFAPAQPALVWSFQSTRPNLDQHRRPYYLYDERGNPLNVADRSGTPYTVMSEPDGTVRLHLQRQLTLPEPRTPPTM